MKERVFRVRQGRRNETKICNNGTVVKRSLVKEKHRQLRLGREAWALRIAKDRGVYVPEVIDYYMGNGVEVLITSFINGTDLTFVSEQEKVIAMQNVGQQMLKLSSVASGFGWPHPDTHIGEFDNWYDFLLHFVNMYGVSICQDGIISTEKIEKTKELLRKINPQLKTPSLVHRDIKPGNVIKGDYYYWIIDWENALLGDPLFDPASYAANFGRDHLWKSLALGFGVNISSELYMLYETIILIGTIDFLNKEGLNFDNHLKRMLDILSLL